MKYDSMVASDADIHLYLSPHLYDAWDFSDDTNQTLKIQRFTVSEPMTLEPTIEPTMEPTMRPTSHPTDVIEANDVVSSCPTDSNDLEGKDCDFSSKCEYDEEICSCVNGKGECEMNNACSQFSANWLLIACLYFYIFM